MILVDTSVWIDHFRAADKSLRDALYEGRVVTHQFVVGELALGHLRQREEIFGLLKALPHVQAADQEQVMDFVEAAALAGSGVGWVDAHLLCAANRESITIWTNDRPLRLAAARLGLSHAP